MDHSTHHTDEQSSLLGSTPDTGVSDDTNSETSGETGETDRETSAELDETGVQWHWRGDYTGETDVSSSSTDDI
jgi:hypothetical protein